MTNRGNQKQQNANKEREQTENGKTQGKTANRCPNRIADILVAIQPIIGRMRPDAEGAITVRLNGDLEQMTIDIYTTEPRSPAAESQLMNQIKSEHEESRLKRKKNVQSKVGAKMEQF